MPVAFGFGVGDFLAVISLSIKICQALDESSDATKDFFDIKQELLTFTQTIEDVEAAVLGGSTISERSFQRLHGVLGACATALKDFQSFLSSFNELSSVLKKVSWATSGRSKMQAFRSRIQTNLVVLGLIQQDIQRNALAIVRTEMTQGNDNISSEIRQRADDVCTNVVSSLQWPGDQRTIRFQDATGRRYPVPLEIVRNFDDFVSFLRFAFKDSPLLGVIDSEYFWLFTPSGSQQKLWFLIEQEDWAYMAQPGMTLGMSFNNNGTPKPGLACDHGHVSQVRFTSPLPAWATYEYDTEFRYIRAPKKKSGSDVTQLRDKEKLDESRPLDKLRGGGCDCAKCDCEDCKKCPNCSRQY